VNIELSEPAIKSSDGRARASPPNLVYIIKKIQVT
jgi:hypothetical protein